MPRNIEAEKARKFIRTLPDNYLQCRRFGHSWRHLTAERVGRGAFVQELVCRECTAQKTEIIDSSGDLISASLHYPEGYLSKGMGYSVRAQKGTLRLETLDRVGV